MSLSRRGRLRKIYLVPTAVVFHVGGTSRHQNPDELVMVGQESLMIYLSKFGSKKRPLLFKLFYKPLFTGGGIPNLIFEFLYFLKYNTIKKTIKS
jgi:GT2 family glycosyltransferase